MEISLDHLQIWPYHQKQERVDIEGWTLFTQSEAFYPQKFISIII